MHERVAARKPPSAHPGGAVGRGLPGRGRRPGGISARVVGRMRQRVMIAMAMINQPALLIADEPTSALDVTIQAQILELLARAPRGVGHGRHPDHPRSRRGRRSCDDVAVMYAGWMVEEGPTVQLFGRPAHPYSWGLMGSLPSLAIGWSAAAHPG